MSTTVIMFSPFIFGLLSIAVWAAFARCGWTRRTALILLSIPIIAMTLYAVGYVASIIGDRLYKGSGEQFDTGPHYIVTYPMLLAGFFLAPASILVTTAGGIITRIRKRCDQGAGGYGSPAAGSKKR